MLSYLQAKLRDPDTWERILWTAAQSAAPAMLAFGTGDALVVGGLAAAVNLILVLLPTEEPASFWAQVALRTGRTWIAAFAGVALAATSTLNTDLLQAAVTAAGAAAIAVVKGSAGQFIGDPETPSWLPEDMETDGVRPVAAASRSQGFLPRLVRGQADRRKRRHRRHHKPGNASGVRGRVVDLTNHERTTRGLTALGWDDHLADAAQAHAVDQDRNHFMSHSSSNGTPWFKRVESYFGRDYARIAENTGAGFNSPESIVNAWMNSPEHRRNILDGSLRLIGVGQSGESWTQDFGRR
jgi:uncharacterized protein YkwD